MQTRFRYGDWHIQYDPPPIPVRTMDWHYWHDDFDGAPDACDTRYGSVGSALEAMDAIDDYEEERFDERGCEHGCPYGLLQMAAHCLKHDRCIHRDFCKSRDTARAALAEPEERGEGK